MFGKWCKKITVCNFNSDSPVNFESLGQSIEKYLHQPIKPSEVKSEGFSSILGFELENVFYHSHEQYFFCSFTFEKKAINQIKLGRLVTVALREKATEHDISISEADKRFRAELRPVVRKKLIEDTEPSEEYLNVIIDNQNKRIYFSECSEEKIKVFVDRVSKIIMGFYCEPLFAETLETILTSWVYDAGRGKPQCIELGDSAVLQSEMDAKATLVKQDLRSEELTILINCNKQVLELAVCFKSRLCFRLTKKGELLHLKAFGQLADTLGKLDVDQSAVDLLGMYCEHWLCQIKEVAIVFDWLLEVVSAPHN